MTVQPRTRPFDFDNPDCRHEEVSVEDLPGNKLKFKCRSCWCMWFEERPPVRIDLLDTTGLEHPSLNDIRRKLRLWEAFAGHCAKYGVDPLEVPHAFVKFGVPVQFGADGEAEWYA